MARYLVIAHQTAASQTLIDRALDIRDRDAAARFTLLIPATHPTDLLTWDPESRFTWNDEIVLRNAREKANEARAAFEQFGLRVDAARVGDASPVLAAEDELRVRPGRYDAIVLSTLPAPRSRWIAEDVTGGLDRLGLQMIHVSGNPIRVRRPLSVVRGALSRFSLPPALHRLFANPETRTGMLLIGALMATYLIGSAVLALTVNRAFFMNDAIALVVFGGLLGWLLMSVRRIPN